MTYEFKVSIAFPSKIILYTEEKINRRGVQILSDAKDHPRGLYGYLITEKTFEKYYEAKATYRN